MSAFVAVNEASSHPFPSGVHFNFTQGTIFFMALGRTDEDLLCICKLGGHARIIKMGEEDLLTFTYFCPAFVLLPFICFFHFCPQKLNISRRDHMTFPARAQLKIGLGVVLISFSRAIP
jgi:hypothetical protein